MLEGLIGGVAVLIVVVEAGREAGLWRLRRLPRGLKLLGVACVVLFVAAEAERMWGGPAPAEAAPAVIRPMCYR